MYVLGRPNHLDQKPNPAAVRMKHEYEKLNGKTFLSRNQSTLKLASKKLHNEKTFSFADLHKESEVYNLHSNVYDKCDHYYFLFTLVTNYYISIMISKISFSIV